jgi:hypothetical protein
LAYEAKGDEDKLKRLQLRCRDAVLPGIEWWKTDVIGRYIPRDMELYAAARVFSPKFVANHPDLTELSRMIDVLGSGDKPLFYPPEVDHLKSCLPFYVQRIYEEGPLAVEMPTLKWWRRHMMIFLPMVFAVRRIAVLLQTSASCERVLSQLNQVLREQQETQMLEDALETHLMARYNRRHTHHGSDNDDEDEQDE